MEDKKLTEQMLKSGELTQAVVKAANNMGMTPARICSETGLDPSVVNRAISGPSPTELIAEVEATLPAKLYKIASMATDELLSEGKMTDMSGTELARMITYCLHNARLMQNKSTSNVSTISHYLHRINQPPQHPVIVVNEPLTGEVTPKLPPPVRTHEGEDPISPTTGEKRLSSNTILPEDPVVLAEQAARPKPTAKPKLQQTMIKGRPVGKPYVPKAQVKPASSAIDWPAAKAKQTPSDALAELLAKAPTKPTGAIPPMPACSPRMAPNVYDPDSDGGSL
jgi:hypothetical protein